MLMLHIQGTTNFGLVLGYRQDGAWLLSFSHVKLQFFLDAGTMSYQSKTLDHYCDSVRKEETDTELSR